MVSIERILSLYKGMDGDEELFWVERPSDLLRPPRPKRSKVAAYNDVTKLVIIAAIVLAILRVKGWALIIAIILLVIVFVFYNRYPCRNRNLVGERVPTEATYDECKAVMTQVGRKSAVEEFTRPRLTPELDAPRGHLKEVSTEPIPEKVPEDTFEYSEPVEEANKYDWESSVTFVTGPSVSEEKQTKFRYQGQDEFRPVRAKSKTPVVTRPNHLLYYYETLEDDRDRVAYEQDTEMQSAQSSLFGY